MYISKFSQYLNYKWDKNCHPNKPKIRNKLVLINNIFININILITIFWKIYVFV